MKEKKPMVCRMLNRPVDSRRGVKVSQPVVSNNPSRQKHHPTQDSRHRNIFLLHVCLFVLFVLKYSSMDLKRGNFSFLTFFFFFSLSHLLKKKKRKSEKEITIINNNNDLKAISQTISQTKYGNYL